MRVNSMDHIPWQLRQLLVEHWGIFVGERIEQGWKGYLVTFTFNKLAGGERAILEQMRNEIERFYASLVKRVVRKPTSPNWQHKLPILIGCPDFAGSRHGRRTLQDLTINGGLHFHVIILIPAQSRLREGLIKHIQLNYDTYRGERKRISTIDLQRITDAPGSVVGYSQKAFKSGRFLHDHLLVLPKALSELPEKGDNDGEYEFSTKKSWLTQFSPDY